MVIRLVRNRYCPSLRTVQHFPEDPRTQLLYSIFRLLYEYGSAEEEAECGEVWRLERRDVAWLSYKYYRHVLRYSPVIYDT